jgi:hypothetical protein
MKKLLTAVVLTLMMAPLAFGATRTLTFSWSQDINSTIVFSWSAVQGAVKYQLRVHEDGTPYDPCSGMAFCGDIQGTSQSIALKPGTKYDWWVAALQADGTVGPSTGSSFVTSQFAGWNLYQASQAGGPYSFVTMIPFVSAQADYTSAQSITVPDGQKTTLFFTITALNTNGESVPSNEVSATIDLTPPPIQPPTGLGTGATVPIVPVTLKVTVTTP